MRVDWEADRPVTPPREELWCSANETREKFEKHIEDSVDHAQTNTRCLMASQRETTQDHQRMNLPSHGDTPYQAPYRHATPVLPEPQLNKLFPSQLSTWNGQANNTFEMVSGQEITAQCSKKRPKKRLRLDPGVFKDEGNDDYFARDELPPLKHAETAWNWETNRGSPSSPVVLLKKRGKGKNKATKNTKSPKPKRPLSAYNLFFRDERRRILAANELVSTPGGRSLSKAMLPKLALNAGSGSACTSPKFVEQAPSLTIKSDSDQLDDSIPVSKLLSAPLNASKNTRKRGRCQPVRKKTGLGELSKVVGERWRALDPQIKWEYSVRAEQEALRQYKDEIESYSEKFKELERQKNVDLRASSSDACEDYNAGTVVETLATPPDDTPYQSVTSKIQPIHGVGEEMFSSPLESIGRWFPAGASSASETEDPTDICSQAGVEMSGFDQKQCPSTGIDHEPYTECFEDTPFCSLLQGLLESL